MHGGLRCPHVRTGGRSPHCAGVFRVQCSCFQSAKLCRFGSSSHDWLTWRFVFKGVPNTTSGTPHKEPRSSAASVLGCFPEAVPRSEHSSDSCYAHRGSRHCEPDLPFPASRLCSHFQTRCRYLCDKPSGQSTIGSGSPTREPGNPQGTQKQCRIDTWVCFPEAILRSEQVVHHCPAVQGCRWQGQDAGACSIFRPTGYSPGGDSHGGTPTYWSENTPTRNSDAIRFQRLGVLPKQDEAFRALGFAFQE